MQERGWVDQTKGGGRGEVGGWLGKWMGQGMERSWKVKEKGRKCFIKQQHTQPQVQ